MKKHSGRFNITDFVIILALLAIVCGFIFRKPATEMTERLFYSADITYEVEVASAYIHNVSTDDEIFDISGVSLGIVTKIMTSNSNTAILLIETEGKHDSHGNYIGDSIFIAPGKTLDLFLSDNKVIPALVKKVEYRR